MITTDELKVQLADYGTAVKDLEEALGVLLAPSMTPEALETFLARAMTAAAGLGMTAVRAEEDEDA